MTRLCAAIFVIDPAQAQRDAALAAEAGADMVELRIDEFADADPLALHALLESVGLPAIVTCRPTWEGGNSALPDEQRLRVLESAAGAGAAYVDVELASVKNLGLPGVDVAPAPRETRAGLIVSAHDFVGRPAKLDNLLVEMLQTPADVAKIVWTARTIRDNLEAFEILCRASRPTIALCMGEAGIISRVLAKKFGAFLTFASVGGSRETAPGQISLHDMKHLYRWVAVGRQTRVFGVVGSPVAHSMSPAIHNAAFDRTGFDGVYLPLLVNPGYESFKAFMESFLAFSPLDLSGLSITIPHKENALRYLQEKGAAIDELAARIGAVNTIVVERSTGAVQLRGLNTDYGAILDSITAKLGIQREDLAGRRVAVLGAGGAARAAVAALAQFGATVVIYNRTLSRAQALAEEFTGKTGKVVAAPMEKLRDSCCQIYLNTTSVGMHPHVLANPLGPTPPRLGPGTLVFDTVYNPMRTTLLSQAESAGAPTIGGIEMFVRQAAAQFQAWTGLPAPVEAMRQVAESRLADSFGVEIAPNRSGRNERE